MPLLTYNFIPEGSGRYGSTDTNTQVRYKLNEANAAASWAQSGASAQSTLTVQTGSSSTVFAGVMSPFGFPGALYLNSSSRLVTTVAYDISAATNFTLSCWIYVVAQTGSNAWIFLRPANAVGTWTAPFINVDMLLQTGGNVAFEVRSTNAGGTTYSCASTYRPPLSQWTHIAGTFDSTLGSANLKLFINGVSHATTTSLGVPATVTSQWIVGANGATPAAEFFNGIIADIRIENVTRSAAYLLAQAKLGLGI